MHLLCFSLQFYLRNEPAQFLWTFVAVMPSADFTLFLLLIDRFTDDEICR